MKRGIVLLVLASLLVIVSALPAAAQDGPDARTAYKLNLRVGPGTRSAVITVLPADTGLKLEARNANTSWLLVHTEDNSLRGWVSAQYLNFAPGVNAAGLPLSEELLSAPANQPAAPPSGGAALPAGTLDLHAYPIMPTLTGRAYAAFQKGQARGRQPNVVAKVGDCATAHPYFLNPFALGQYDLGEYGYLAGVIGHYGGSLGAESLAAHAGFISGSVLDPMWANPAMCQAGESPLACEFRIRQPGIALIMFGTTDVQYATPEQFAANLRAILDATYDAGVVPVLSTFPVNTGFMDRSLQFNQIVLQVAAEYDVPLINLWLALEPLPNQGVAPDGTHLSEPVYGGPGFLVPQNLTQGYPMRNLITLQALDLIWHGLPS